MPNFRLNQPITFKEGTGFTIDQNGVELYVASHTGVVFSIGQNVGSGSNVQFNEVTSSKIIIDNGSLILSGNTISGSFTQTGNISISNDESSVTIKFNTTNLKDAVSFSEDIANNNSMKLSKIIYTSSQDKIEFELILN